MSKVLYRSIREEAVKEHLERFILPADPDAEMKKEGDEWVIIGNAMMSKKPVIIKKS